MNKPGVNHDLTKLKEFIIFLKQEKFIEVCNTYLELLKDSELPILKLFTHFSPEAIQNKISESLSDFFNDIIVYDGLATSVKNVELWKANALPDVPHLKIEVTDILLLNSLRKQLLLSYLPNFNNDSRVSSSIMIALEKLFVYTEKISIEAYIEIHHKELFEKKEFFSKLIENSINGVWVVDTGFNIIEWNPIMETEFNIIRKDALGKNIFNLLPHFGDSKEGKSLLKVLKDGEKLIIRDNQFSPEGRWYDTFIAPLYDNDGAIRGALSIFHDITVRKEVENKLQEHQERLQATNEELLDQQNELKKANTELQTNICQLTEVKNILKENEARLLEAQSIAHLGSWEYDIQKDKIYWSDEMKSIFGYDHDETLDYKTYLSLLHPDDAEKINQSVSKTLETNEPYSLEHRIVRKDKSVRFLIANGRAVLSDDNKVVKLQGTGLDITSLRLVESEKDDKQYFIQKIMDTTPDFITVFDLNSLENVFTNRDLYEKLGYSAHETEEIHVNNLEGLKNIFHPRDFPMFVDLLKSFENYRGNETKEFEYRIKNKGGEWVWIWSRYNVFKKSAEGLAVQLIGISRDITGRKKGEKKILENKARLKESQVMAKLGYWELNPQTNEVYWSDELFRIYGIKKKSTLQLEEISKRILPQDQVLLMEKIRTTISTGEPYQIQYRILQPGNKLKYVNSKGEAIKNTNGKVTKIKGITQDITEKKIVDQKLQKAYEDLKETHEELKRSEEALRSLNNELESRVFNRTIALQESNDRLIRKNTDLDNFIYTASHDLKVPIANIEGLLNILKKKVDSKLKENDKILLNMMEQSVSRFNATIKDLTEISKIQKDLEEENSEKISISEILNDLFQDIAGLIADKNCKIYTNFTIDEIFFTKKNLRSILYNLIVNSLKYCASDRVPEIKINADKINDGVLISISDNGMGIPENQLSKIFSLFKRYHTQIEGSGIGLYIVKRIIENNGGKVVVESEVNVGTTFKLIFTYKS